MGLRGERGGGASGERKGVENGRGAWRDGGWEIGAEDG